MRSIKSALWSLLVVGFLMPSISLAQLTPAATITTIEELKELPSGSFFNLSPALLKEFMAWGYDKKACDLWTRTTNNHATILLNAPAPGMIGEGPDVEVRDYPVNLDLSVVKVTKLSDGKLGLGLREKDEEDNSLVDLVLDPKNKMLKAFVFKIDNPKLNVRFKDGRKLASENTGRLFAYCHTMDDEKEVKAQKPVAEVKKKAQPAVALSPGHKAPKTFEAEMDQLASEL